MATAKFALAALIGLLQTAPPDTLPYDRSEVGLFASAAFKGDLLEICGGVELRGDEPAFVYQMLYSALILTVRAEDGSRAFAENVAWTGHHRPIPPPSWGMAAYAFLEGGEHIERCQTFSRDKFVADRFEIHPLLLYRLFLVDGFPEEMKDHPAFVGNQPPVGSYELAGRSCWVDWSRRTVTDCDMRPAD